MQVMYQSTRGKGEPVTASQAILKGLSEDGGLFVPTSIPSLDVSMEELSQMSYQETAYQVMSRLLTDFTEEELRTCINSAYDKKFDTDVIAPLKEADGAYFLELFHGPTIAFKDMALSILPYLMTTAAKKNNVKNEIVILTATSGDTGKAALAGFADVPGTRIIVFYPKHGVSPIQEKQMVTQKGTNTYVVGITGNFDDAQTAVKKMFNDKEMAAELADAASSFLPPTPLISDVLFRRSYIMYTLMPHWSARARSGRPGDQRGSTYRKLRKHSGSILCETDGTSGEEADLCIQ